MSDFILPFIGESGIYTLMSPFDNVIDTNARYSCQAIRTINDYLAENKNVYEEFYKPVNISEALYDVDAKDNVPIITLQSNAGHWVNVPANYILKYPDTNGIPYSNRMMTFSFPGIPDAEEVNLSYMALAEEIKDLIATRTGITPRASFERVSRINLITQEEHQRVTDQRETSRTKNSTTYSQLLQLQAHVTMLNSRIVQLTNYINNN